MTRAVTRLRSKLVKDIRSIQKNKMGSAKDIYRVLPKKIGAELKVCSAVCAQQRNQETYARNRQAIPETLSAEEVIRTVWNQEMCQEWLTSIQSEVVTPNVRLANFGADFLELTQATIKANNDMRSDV